MAWTLPRTWVAGEIVTASICNTHIRDNERYLKGLDGTITFSDGVDLGANELTINALEIVGVDGEVNKTVIEDHTHADTANCGQVDHGAACVAASLLDDDHTQYVLESLLTTQADLPYATGASTWTRLPKGTANQSLRMNAGATAPEWTAGVGTKQFFIDVGCGYSGTATSDLGDFAGRSLAAAGYWYVNLRVPQDFASLTTCHYVFVSSNTTTFGWTATTDFGALTEAYNIHSGTVSATGVAVTAGVLDAIAISSSLTGLAANDYVGIKLVIDTLTAGIIRVIGLVFTYA